MNPLGRKDIIKRVVVNTNLNEEDASNLVDGLFSELSDLMASDDTIRIHVKTLGVFRMIYSRVVGRKRMCEKLLDGTSQKKIRDSSVATITAKHERYSKLLKLLQEDYKKKLEKKELKRKYYESHNNLEEQKSNSGGN